MTPHNAPSLLDEIKAWKRRIDEAAYDNEPVYVSPEEYLDLRTVFAEESRRSPMAPPVNVAFVGRPLVIDSEKAAEQRKRWGWVSG